LSSSAQGDEPPRDGTGEPPQSPPQDVASAYAEADDAGVTEAGTATAESSPSEPRVLQVWASIELAVACAFLVLIFAAVFWQVVSRYVPRLNWQGVSELASYSLIVLTFIMVGYLIGKNGHITIQIIDYLVKGRAFMLVRIVSAICVAVICAALVREAYALILAYPTRRTAALEIPIWILYAIPLIGFASGTLRAVVNIFLSGRPEAKFDAGEAK
jgi:TRAP-type C4-dicarboxylate transport system permease small subunit